MRISHPTRAAALFVSALHILLLAGCSTSFDPGLTPSSSDTELSGTAYGGQSPIVGAAVYAFSSGTSAYQAASTSLIASGGVTGYPTAAGTYGNYVATDANGYFKIAATTPCTVGSITYLYSTGGNPGSGINTAAGLLAALGVCTDGLLIDSVTSSRIHVNEVSTIAAAYALAGFATDPTHISAPSASDTLAATGIQNAVRNAAQLYSVAPTGSDATSVANATTPYGNGIVQQARIDTLANILAACVNSPGSTSTPCATLKTNATSSGTTTGTAPSDTAGAAINIAHFPGSNVTTFYNLVGSTANPFNPALNAVPNDFTISISFSGGGLAYSDLQGPHSVAVDGNGSIWVVNFSNNLLSEFSALGVPANPDGTTGNGLNGPFNIAVDTSGSVWVTNDPGGTISKFSAADYALPGSPYTNSAFANLGDIAFDGTGNLWVTDIGYNRMYKLPPAATSIALTVSTDLSDPFSISFQGGFLYVANAASCTGYCGSTTGYKLPLYSLSGTLDVAYTQPGSAVATATDGYDSVWVVEDNGAASHVYNYYGQSAVQIAPAANTPYIVSVAVDGASNAWFPDDNNGTLYEYNYNNVAVSPATGYLVDPDRGSPYPSIVAIDGSGNVWYRAYDAYLYEVVGAAVPVATPIAYQVANSKSGHRP